MAKGEKTSLQDLPDSWLVNDRRVGNTTRAIDHTIQLLFAGYKVHIQDPWQNGGHEEANKDMFKRVLRRFRSEHCPIDLKFDSKKLTIELLEPAKP